MSILTIESITIEIEILIFAPKLNAGLVDANARESKMTRSTFVVFVVRVSGVCTGAIATLFESVGVEVCASSFFSTS